MTYPSICVVRLLTRRVLYLDYLMKLSLPLYSYKYIHLPKFVFPIFFILFFLIFHLLLKSPTRFHFLSRDIIFQGRMVIMKTYVTNFRTLTRSDLKIRCQDIPCLVTHLPLLKEGFLSYWRKYSDLPRCTNRFKDRVPPLGSRTLFRTGNLFGTLIWNTFRRLRRYPLYGKTNDSKRVGTERGERRSSDSITLILRVGGSLPLV